MSDATPDDPRLTRVLTDVSFRAAAAVLDPDVLAPGPWPQTRTGTHAQAREAAMALAAA